jgi:hypothetical protein
MWGSGSTTGPRPPFLLESSQETLSHSALNTHTHKHTHTEVSLRYFSFVEIEKGVASPNDRSEEECVALCAGRQPHARQHFLRERPQTHSLHGLEEVSGMMRIITLMISSLLCSQLTLYSFSLSPPLSLSLSLSTFLNSRNQRRVDSAKKHNITK